MRGIIIAVLWLAGVGLVSAAALATCTLVSVLRLVIA